MTTTPYLKLQKPPFDEIPWDDAVNGNMDILDAFISQYMAVPNYVGVWSNSTAYVAGQNTLDTTTAIIYTAAVTHTSAASPTTFAQDRTTNPSYWIESSAGFPIGLYATDEDIVRANNNVGRNLIHNGLFRVTQRGAGPFTTNLAYTADRWLLEVLVSTCSVTVVALTDADRTAIGDERGTAAIQCVTGGTAGATDFAIFEQRIEAVRRLASKTTTVSFWAKSSSGTPKVGLELTQSFGTGGSPSAAVVSIGSQSFSLSTTWTRYTATIAVPSVNGKTFGSTVGTDHTRLLFWLSSGADYNARAGNIGVQSSTIQLWGVQLEIGTEATPLEKLDPRQDLANCQRFYQSGLFEVAGYGIAANGVAAMHSFPTTMRAVPTVASSSVILTNCSGVLANLWEGGLSPYATATISGGVLYNGHFTASADL